MIRGSIWNINLDPTVGAEIKKTRSCLILNSDKIGKLPLKVIALLTDLKEHYRNVPRMVTIEPTKENGLNKISAIDLFQVRSVSEKRLTKRVGKVDSSILVQ
jgi:mRNA interferase MazF